MPHVDQEKLLEAWSGRQWTEILQPAHGLKMNAAELKVGAEIRQRFGAAERFQKQISKVGQLANRREVRKPPDHPELQIAKLPDPGQQSQSLGASELDVEGEQIHEGNKDR